MIVEAKGPGAKLSTGAKKGDQMSKPWVKNTAEEINNGQRLVGLLHVTGRPLIAC